MSDGLDARIELMVAQAVDVARTGRFDVRRSRIGQDPLIEIEMAGPEPHVLRLRVEQGAVLLSVDASDAMEFVEADDRDMRDLEHILRTYCLGELEVHIRVGDGRCHALRTNAGKFAFPDSLSGLFRPSRKEWRRIE